jgi:hypothetical protein
MLLFSLLQLASFAKYQEEMKRFLWLISWLVIFENFITFKWRNLKHNNDNDDNKNNNRIIVSELIM